MSLSANVTVSIAAKQTLESGGGIAQATIADALQALFTDGVGAGQVDRVWRSERTLAASASENIDLRGVLTDVYGAAAVFARVKVLAILADKANVNNVRVTRPASNGVPIFLAAGDGLDIRPGACAIPLFCLDATGVVVTAGTGDLLTVTNSAGGSSVKYRILVLGCSS